jgi:hypothetical protein
MIRGIIIVLAFIDGGWLAFDGTRALILLSSVATLCPLPSVRNAT